MEARMRCTRRARELHDVELGLALVGRSDRAIRIRAPGDALARHLARPTTTSTSQTISSSRAAGSHGVRGEMVATEPQRLEDVSALPAGACIWQSHRYRLCSCSCSNVDAAKHTRNAYAYAYGIGEA